jgi:hypothetical protein
MIIINNVGPALAADLSILGAAVKILLAGGSDLSSDQMQRVCGASRYLWQMRGPEIAALVLDLESATTEAVR